MIFMAFGAFPSLLTSTPKFLNHEIGLSLNPLISRLGLLVCRGEAAFLRLKSCTFSMQILRDHRPTTSEHSARREDLAVASGSALSVALQRLG
jgi:hypothetical protein